jgi:hypothetical protein
MDLLGVDPVACLLLAAFAGVFLWVAFGGKRQLEIVVKDGRVESLRGVARAHIGRVTDFLEHDVRPPEKLKIFGQRDNNGVLRISFHGQLDEGTQQQIRNYLKMVL